MELQFAPPGLAFLAFCICLVLSYKSFGCITQPVSQNILLIKPLVFVVVCKFWMLAPACIAGIELLPSCGLSVCSGDSFCYRNLNFPGFHLGYLESVPVLLMFSLESFHLPVLVIIALLVCSWFLYSAPLVCLFLCQDQIVFIIKVL